MGSPDTVWIVKRALSNDGYPILFSRLVQDRSDGYPILVPRFVGDRRDGCPILVPRFVRDRMGLPEQFR
jgi:hypothetical protein